MDRRSVVTASEAPELDSVLGGLAAEVEALQGLVWSDLSHEAAMAAVGDLEVLRRRLDHATDRLVAHVDRRGAYVVDGHRSTKAALRHVGRLSGPEAHGRVRTARVLRRLPEVQKAYRAGRIPTEMVRAITRTASNPRVRGLLDVADPVFAEQAATEPHDRFVAWLREWEALADADGAAQHSERTHQHRDATFVHNTADDSWHLRANFGALQGAAIAEILDAYGRAELDTDRHDAAAVHGPDARPDQYPRTPAQRRADALFAALRRAQATPAGATDPEPLVNIVVDQATFEAELSRVAGARRSRAHGSRTRPTGGELGDLGDPSEGDGRVCRTVSGHRLHPSDAVAAALVGHLRRVVVDTGSTVIDLGRRRRLFTGAARDAAVLQAALGHSDGARCFWSGCDAPLAHVQVDHHQPWHRGGATDIANSALSCGHHNRLKEAGYRPVRGPDGSWTLHRPDGTPITPAS